MSAQSHSFHAWGGVGMEALPRGPGWQGMEALPSPGYLPRGPGWQGMEALRSPGYLPRAQAGTICSQQVLTHTFLGWLFLHGSEQQA